MPSYTYKCECGYASEQIHGPKKRLRLFCPVCEGKLQWQFPCPNLHTDTTWLANRDDGFGADNTSRQRAYAKARAAGVNPVGKVYCPSLCRPGVPLDPEAWVTGKADVKRVCRKNNWSSPEMGVKADKIAEDPGPYRVAPDIVQNEVERIEYETGGDLTAKERKELPEATAERLAGNAGRS